MTHLITCTICHKERAPARRDAIFCAECYAEIDRDMEEIAKNHGANADDLFERIEANRVGEYKPSFGAKS